MSVACEIPKPSPTPSEFSDHCPIMTCTHAAVSSPGRPSSSRRRLAASAGDEVSGTAALELLRVMLCPLVIAMAGGCLGVALSFPAAQWIGRKLGQFIPVFHISTETIYFDLLAAFVVGAVAGIFPTWRGATIRIADGLRRIA